MAQADKHWVLPRSTTNAYADNSLIYTGPGRRVITNKLNQIHLDNISFDSLPLGEVLRDLSKQSKLRDPAHEGINFLINPNPDQTGAGMIDPATGLPVATNAAPVEDLVALPITLNRVLTNTSLGDVLDAVVSASPRPIHYSVQDFAIVFSAGKLSTPLYSRVFAVDPRTFPKNLKEAGIDVGSSTNSGEQVSAGMKNFLATLGVDLKSPPGKAIFYNDTRGRLFVKATEQDLDTIERALEVLNSVPPQIHIKARFLEVPPGTLAGFGNLLNATNAVTGEFTGILNDTNARAVLHSLESRDDVKTQAEPEVTTLSGRQTQMRATEVVTAVTKLTFQDTFTNQDGVLVTNAIVPQTEKIETGPILDVVPYVLADGYTINLVLIPSVTEFLGYDKTTNITAAYNRAGERIDVPSVLPRFTVRRVVTTLNLWDNQTAIIGGLSETTYVNGSTTAEKPKARGKELLVFITATIVDPAGNRVHTDDELSSSRTGIPAQPPRK